MILIMENGVMIKRMVKVNLKELVTHTMENGTKIKKRDWEYKHILTVLSIRDNGKLV